MALLLREAEVEQVLDMGTAIRAVEEALRQQGLGKAPNQPRRRIFVPSGVLHVMAGGMPDWGVMGLKAYAAVKGAVRFVVLLFGTDTGELLAILEADQLGRLRTGAATGVATKYLARADAAVVGVFGTGRQARTQAQAVCAVRRVRELRVFGRDTERRQRFAAELEALVGCRVRPVGSPEPPSPSSTDGWWSRASTSTWPAPTGSRRARWTMRSSAGPTASWWTRSRTPRSSPATWRGPWSAAW